jgi:hypothetical protein
MPQRHFPIAIQLIVCVALVAIFPISVLAKDAPETALIKDGRYFEAVLLLEAKPKDLTAQKQATELCIKLALYERAAERLVASGASREEALATVIDSALAQGHTLSAQRLAEAQGAGAVKTTKAKIARFELSEGRRPSAQAYARAAEDQALIADTRLALYKDLFEAEPFILPMSSTKPDRLLFSRDGRFALVWDSEKLDQLEVLPVKADGQPGRQVMPMTRINAFSLSEDGRFLALSISSPDNNGKSVNEFRIERLDSGLEVCTAVYNEKLRSKSPLAITKKGGRLQISALEVEAFYDYVCAYPGSLAIARTKLYQDGNWRNGSAKGILPSRLESPLHGGSIGINDSSVSPFWIYGRTVQNGPMSQPLGTISPLVFYNAITADFTPDEERVGILAMGEGSLPEKETKKSDKSVVILPNARAERGVFMLPYPFFDRAERAAALAAELGLGEDLIPFCDTLIAQGDYSRALEILRLAGIDETKRFGRVGEAKLKTLGIAAAAEDLVKAGKGDLVVSETDAMLAKIPDTELVQHYKTAVKLYELAGMSADSLLVSAAKRVEAAGRYQDAVQLYEEAGAKQELERLAFGRVEIFDGNLNDIKSWCEYVGKKAGLSATDINVRITRGLEARKRWAILAEVYARTKDAENFRRVVKAELAEKDGIDDRIVELVIAQKDTAFSKALASSLLGRDLIETAVEVLEATGDSAGVIGIADATFDRGDFKMANEIYVKYGTKSARATNATRLGLVFEALSEPLRIARLTFSSGLFERIKNGELALIWPVPDSKLEDSGYKLLKSLGQSILALPAKPSAMEAQKCAVCMGFVVERDNKQGATAQARLDSNIEDWFTIAATFLKKMGR